MWPLTAAFIDIALHRSGPERLPSASFLVVTLLAVYFPINILRMHLAGEPLYLLLLVDTAVFLLFVYGVLKFFRKQQRFNQTVSALLGTDILINLIGIPVSSGGSAAADTSMDTVLAVALLLLFLWWMDVAGYILAKAVDQPYIVGVMFIVFYVVAAFSIISNLVQPTV